MRSLRFRAWDESTMKYNVVPLFGEKGPEIIEHHPLAGFRLHSVKDIMQFTGLHDKNGKEIYEGDLIKNKYGRICEVVWMEHFGCWDAHVREFGFKREGGHLGFQNNEWSRCVIVIGNIYENPELLETK